MLKFNHPVLPERLKALNYDPEQDGKNIIEHLPKVVEEDENDELKV
jgi:hypothetical protein